MSQRSCHLLLQTTSKHLSWHQWYPGRKLSAGHYSPWPLNLRGRPRNLNRWDGRNRRVPLKDEITVFLEPNTTETRHDKCMKCKLWWTMYQLVDLDKARVQQKSWNNATTHKDMRSMSKRLLKSKGWDCVSSRIDRASLPPARAWQCRSTTMMSGGEYANTSPRTRVIRNPRGILLL